MFYWVIQTTILSIIFIFLVHYLIDFFKATLTVPKIKDLVNTPTEKYDKIFSVISKNDNPKVEIKEINKEEDMKSELKNFLKSQMASANSTTEIASLDMFNEENYSPY